MEMFPIESVDINDNIKAKMESSQSQCLLSYLQTQLVLLSGKTGDQIGTTVVLDSTETASHLLHRTEKGSYYVLLQKGLCMKSSVTVTLRANRLSRFSMISVAFYPSTVAKLKLLQIFFNA